MAESVILVDVPSGVDIAYSEGFLRRLGHPVEVCHGPDHGTLCPILSGAGCPKAEGAHGIVFELDLERPQHRAILARYQEVLKPDIPIRVVVRPGQEVKYRDVLADVQVWTHEPTIGELDGFAAEVEAADFASEAS